MPAIAGSAPAFVWRQICERSKHAGAHCHAEDIGDKDVHGGGLAAHLIRRDGLE